MTEVLLIAEAQIAEQSLIFTVGIEADVSGLFGPVGWIGFAEDSPFFPFFFSKHQLLQAVLVS